MEEEKEISLEVREEVQRMVKELGKEQEPYHLSETDRGTIQLEYEKDDDSYLEYEVFPDSVHILKVMNREYSKAESWIESKGAYKEMREILSEFLKEG